MEAPVARALETPKALNLRVISRAAAVSALALLLPLLFHALHLGHIFLPMYLPILAGAFLLPTRWAAGVGLATPCLSAVATGMPPLMPPVAAWMAVELGVMAGAAAVASRRLRWPPWVVVPAVLILGRIVYLGLVFWTAEWLGLPPRLLSLAALLAGWPGMILAMLVVPASVRMARTWGGEA